MNLLPLFALYAGDLLDMFGVLIIVGGTLASVLAGIRDNLQKKHSVYLSLRKNLGRSILLGLEFLIAGDIIASVTGSPSFTSIGILAIVVVIRAFLSVTFEMEIDGHWPWQKSQH